jgi:hypothetical protein
MPLCVLCSSELELLVCLQAAVSLMSALASRYHCWQSVRRAATVSVLVVTTSSTRIDAAVLPLLTQLRVETCTASARVCEQLNLSSSADSDVLDASSSAHIA